MKLFAFRLLCFAGMLFGLSQATAQAGGQAANSGAPAPAQTDQSDKQNKKADQPSKTNPIPRSLQQSLEKFEKIWSTQFDGAALKMAADNSLPIELGKITLTIQNTLSNYQVFYRYPGDLRPTKVYPRADKQNGKIELDPKQNIFLVEFRACGDKIPCLDVAEDTTDKGNSSPESGDCPETHILSDSSSGPDPCTVDVVFVRDLYGVDRNGNKNLIPAFVITKGIFAFSEDLIKKTKTETNWPTFVINKIALRDYFKDENPGLVTSGTYLAPNAAGTPVPMSLIAGWASVRDFEIGRYPPDTSCRPYAHEEEKILVSRPNYKPVKLGADNGIMLYPPKVFDVFTLRQMLAATSSQLAGLAGFNQASINGAFGNIQGVTTDTSYLAAQVTTVATPTVVSQAVNGNSGVNSLGNTAGTTGLNTTSTSTLTCPAGTLPGIGTAGLPACVSVVTAASGTGGNPVGFTGAGNVNGGVSTLNGGTTSNGTNTTNSNSSSQNTNQQNTTTTTSGGQAGTIAAIPVSNVPSAPTNIGVSSQDILAEQVQLNSQITTLRMALQGALSDQYLVAAGRTAGNRQQTTLGINVSLDPPSRYKHAVAEVRIWVYPMAGKPVSIVNLLPSAKTYNVAKITSNQNAFGAGVVIDPVNVGIAGGKTKNRLFLAKDTDTVALEYPADRDETPNSWPNGAEPISRSIHEHIRDGLREGEIWQSISDACVENPGPLPGNRDNQTNPVIFGWQFRPVLGADYVQSGMRQVFAQLALPGSPSQVQMSASKVYVQTRWREYDEKRQVLGAVYKGSCSITENTDPITVASPLKVRRVYVDDMGGGIVKVKAEGNFFASGFTAMTGPNTLSPTTFNGESIQFFASASSLLMADDLKLVSEDGVTTDVGVSSNHDKNCGIGPVRLSAIPRPDGNSWVELLAVAGADFDKQTDGPIRPLVLIGSQVFGLHETPFFEDAESACTPKPVSCTFHFLAPTSAIRAAQTYKFRDLSWKDLGKAGKIDFDPSFNALTILGPDSSASGSDPTDATAKLSPVYTLSGTDLIKPSLPVLLLNCTTPGCLQVFQGFSQLTLNADNFAVTSPTTAILRFGPQIPAPQITVKTDPSATTISLALPAPASSGAAPAAAWTVSSPCPGRCTPPAPRPACACGAAAPAGRGQNPPPPPLLLYTINGTTPTVTAAGTIAAPTFVYRSTTPINAMLFPDNATTTVMAITVGTNLTPSETAVSKFYRIGNSVLPLYTPPSLSSYKFYRFVWHPTVATADPVEWDLSVPANAAKAGVTASGILNQGDSTEVDFTGVDVLANSTATPITFAFDNTLIPNALFSYDTTKKTLKLMITSAITAKPGHKEVIMNAFVPGTDGTTKATQIILPFDVTKR